MKNFFIVHALGNNANDYWYPWVKNKIEYRGYTCLTPTLPPIEEMSYSSWAQEFNKFKNHINSDSIVIGHSTGSVFLVKYLMENNLFVNKFIGVVSFNKRNTGNEHQDWNDINETFFVPDLKLFKNYANIRICYYSPTDIYNFEILDEFANNIDAKKRIIEGGGILQPNLDMIKCLQNFCKIFFNKCVNANLLNNMEKEIERT